MPADDGYYTVTAMFADDTNLKEMEQLADSTLKEKFGKKLDRDDYNWPFMNGSKRARKKEQLHYKDTTYCNIKSRYKPVLLDVKGNELDEDDVTELYSGAYFRAIIRAYAYENKDNDGVSFGLVALQKIRDGEKIGGGGISKEKARALFDDGVAEAESEKKKDKGKGKKKNKNK